MANTEPKVRTRTKTRGGNTITTTKEKKMLPGGGKVKVKTKVTEGPSGVTTKVRGKVKGAEDIQGKKEKWMDYSFQGPKSSMFVEKYKSKGRGANLKKYSKTKYPGPTL
jgi:hypothetical protein